MVVTATYSSGQTREVDHARLNFSVIPAKAGSHTVTITPANENGISATVEVTVAESTTSAVNNSTNLVGAEDNSTGFWGAFSDDFNVPTGETKQIIFTNYSNLAGNWNNFIVILRKADMTEYAVVRADNYGWGNGYQRLYPQRHTRRLGYLACRHERSQVTVYVTNCGNGTADIQAVMEGTTSSTSTQYYLGINTVEPSDLNFALTVDSCHLVFNE